MPTRTFPWFFALVVKAPASDEPQNRTPPKLRRRPVECNKQYRIRVRQARSAIKYRAAVGCRWDRRISACRKIDPGQGLVSSAVHVVMMMVVVVMHPAST